MVGAFFILGFASRKESRTFMGSWLILLTGLLFISDPLFRRFLGESVSILEFIAIIIVLWLTEKFISVNMRGHLSPWYLVGSLVGGTLIIICMGTVYSFVSTVLALTVLTLRVMEIIKVSTWGSETALYVSFSFGLFAVVAYIGNMHTTADFLYFGMTLILILIMIESAVGSFRG